MQTRCPACHTLYRIDDDVLQRAGGQARCFRCDTVFTAEPADEEEEARPYGDLAGHVDEDAPLDLDSSQLATQDDASLGLDELGALPDIPDADGLDIDSELTAVDEEEALAATAELPPEEEEAAAEGELPADSADAPPATHDTEPRFEIPADLPPLEPAEQPAPTPEETLEAKPVSGPSRWPAVAAALLIALALAQLTWQQRQPLLATPAGHAAAEGLCKLVGCRLPARRAPSRYLVLERNIVPAPGRPGVLLMQLSFRNSAEFAQPLPDIQLSLYDSEEKLMARRRLHPDEYLFPAPPADTLVGGGELLQLQLQLEDPGRKATGFKLEFL